MNTIQTLDTSPFKRLVLTIGALPTAFMDSMTYYEALAWLVDYIQNKVIPAVDNNAEALAELQEAFVTLKEYVDTYFDNLDVQEEINNKLDEMAESGELATVIAQLVDLGTMFAYDDIATMSEAENLTDGSICRVLGNTDPLAGDGAYYRVRELLNTDVIDGFNKVTLTNTDNLIAVRIDSPKIDVYKFTTSSSMEDILSAFASTKPKLIQFSKGTYNIDERIDINSDTTIDFGGSTINSTYTDTYGNNMAIMCIATSTTTAYNGAHDVKIMNGVINTSMSFMHARNVKLVNIDFAQDIKGHAIQVAGCKNVEIRDCIFRGSEVSDSGYNHEIIQLETANHDAQPYFPDGSTCFDHTGNYDIRIVGNNFKDGDGITTFNYVAIGHHEEDANNLYSQFNILIAKNTFETSHYWDISLPGMYYAIIEDNTFWQGSVVSGHTAINLRGHQKFVTIRNNNITSDVGAIVASSNIQRENIEIYGNVINVTQTNDGIAFNFRNIKNLYVYDNNITSNDRVIYSAIDGDAMLNENYQIYNNYFNVNASANGGIHVASAGSDDIYVANNIVEQQDQTQPFVRVPSGAKLTYVNNTIKNNSSNATVKSLGTIDDYNDIYGVGVELYAGGASYSAVSAGALAKSALQFNTILLVLHTGGNTSGGITTIRLKNYDPLSKLEARKYAVIANNGWSAATAYGVFEVISGGTTFNWTSGSSNLVLRKVIGYNEQLV